MKQYQKILSNICEAAWSLHKKQSKSVFNESFLPNVYSCQNGDSDRLPNKIIGVIH